MRACVPAAYGGPEADPLTVLRVIEAVAARRRCCRLVHDDRRHDVVAVAVPAAGHGRRRSTATRAVVTGGVFAPNGTGVVDGDTVTVTGRWAWGSGTQHCQWIVGGVLCDDEVVPHLLVRRRRRDVPRHVAHVGPARVGVARLLRRRRRRAAGAHDPAVRRRPDDRRRRSGAFPNFSLLASGVAATGLGIGRRALDELVALAAGKRPQFSSRTLAESPYTQIELARAEAGLRSATAFLHDEVGAAWDRGRRRGPRERGAAGGDPPRRRQRRRAGRPMPPTSPTRSPAARACTRRTCCSAASATPTCRPSTSRPPRSSTRRSAVPSSANRSTPPPSDRPSAPRPGF